MLLRRLTLAVIAAVTLFAGRALAAPPQPPLTTDVANEWRDELLAIHSLSDNAFLYEEASSDFRQRLAAWQGAEVLLNLRVVGVNKEAVICDQLPFGHVTVQNEQKPMAGERQSGERNVSLRIGDVVPLEVARRLRAGDTLVLRGAVAASSYQPGRAIELSIGTARPVAAVARTYDGQVSTRRSAQEFLTTPNYPLQALEAGVDGLAVVTITGRAMKPKLSTSAGHAVLDEAALGSLRQLEPNWHLFPGEHRFAFTILR